MQVGDNVCELIERVVFVSSGKGENYLRMFTGILPHGELSLLITTEKRAREIPLQVKHNSLLYS